jgi:fused signal recognition particle receptor
LGALFGRATVDEALYAALEDALLGADCGVAATQHLLERLRSRARRERIAEPQALKRALQDELRLLLEPLEKPLDLSRARPLAIMIAGVNGSGKTTSIGTLAKWLQAAGKSVLLAAGDTFRAAAREQLTAWGQRKMLRLQSWFRQFS